MFKSEAERKKSFRYGGGRNKDWECRDEGEGPCGTRESKPIRDEFLEQSGTFCAG